MSTESLSTNNTSTSEHFTARDKGMEESKGKAPMTSVRKRLPYGKYYNAGRPWEPYQKGRLGVRMKTTRAREWGMKIRRKLKARLSDPNEEAGPSTRRTKVWSPPDVEIITIESSSEPSQEPSYPPVEYVPSPRKETASDDDLEEDTDSSYYSDATSRHHPEEEMSDAESHVGPNATVVIPPPHYHTGTSFGASCSWESH